MGVLPPEFRGKIAHGPFGRVGFSDLVEILQISGQRRVERERNKTVLAVAQEYLYICISLIENMSTVVPTTYVSTVSSFVVFMLEWTRRSRDRGRLCHSAGAFWTSLSVSIMSTVIPTADLSTVSSLVRLDDRWTRRSKNRGRVCQFVRPFWTSC